MFDSLVCKFHISFFFYEIYLLLTQFTELKLLRMLTQQYYTIYVTYKEMYYRYNPATLIHFTYTIYIMVAIITVFYHAIKIKATNKTTPGLKKSVTIRESEKKRTKRSEIYSNFPQMSKNLCSFLWMV